MNVTGENKQSKEVLHRLWPRVSGFGPYMSSKGRVLIAWSLAGSILGGNGKRWGLGKGSRPLGAWP